VTSYFHISFSRIHITILLLIINMNTKQMSTLIGVKRWLLTFIAPLALLSSTLQAQTVLVNPATDGGFEIGTGSLTDNGWTQVSAAANDTWYTGTGLTSGSYMFPSNTRCAYISKDVGGTTWSYVTTVSPNAAHIYKDVTVPAGQTQVTLSFKYQLNGTNNTKLMVYVCPSNAVPVTTEPQSNGGTVSNNGWGAGTGVPVLLFSAATPQPAGTQTFTASIPASFLNNCNNATSFRIVFTSFRNSSGTSNLPPPAIDSISIVSQVPVAQTPSTFTINNTIPTSGTNFNNFTDAINWVNAVATCGLTNPITINVTAGQVFNENTPYITASANAVNQIIFKKNGTGANPIIRPTGAYMGYQPTTSNPGTQDYGICLHGADYITFDGIDITANNVSQTIAVEYGYLVRNASSTNGANNNTIKNTTIILDRTSYSFAGTTPLTRGIVQTASSSVGGGVSALNANGTNNNNGYYNFTIGNVNQGMIVYGSSGTLPDQNTKIGTLTPGTFNIIGRPGIPDDIGNASTAVLGINLNFQYNATVSNNSIQNLTTNSSTVDGIVIGSPSGVFNGSGGFNNEVANNQISFLKTNSTTSTSTLTGLRIQHDNIGTLGAIGFKIYNNTVSNITSAYAGSATVNRIIKGLWLPAGNPTTPAAVQYEIVNNTIIIDGSSAPNLSNVVFENAHPTSILKIRNNLFYNLTSAQSLASHYVLSITSATTAIGATGSLSNYNDFYYANATGGFLSVNNSITSLGVWQSTFGVDANSLSADPKLNSTTVLYPLLSSPLVAAGPTLSAPYNRDILGALRASGNSTIGAYEQTGDVVSPLISDTTIMGINSTANRSLPGLLRVIDDGGMVANTAGVSPRLYFKKSTEANVFGANTAGFNGWKWVEASNSSTPFDFAINYALLTSTVNTHDVIQYFFVAQDTVSTPNIAALPAAGFVGTSVGAITSAPTTPKSYVIYAPPAAYVSSTATQANTFNALQNSNNNPIIRVALQTGPTGDSTYITEMSFNSITPTDKNNIKTAKVWYTGLNSTFDPFNPTNVQFGTNYTPVSFGALGTIVFNGGQITPPNSTVYFWLTYDISASATIGDSVDASVLSLTYNGSIQVPVVQDPAGTRKVKQAYCLPVPTGNRHISLVSFNTLNNIVGTANFTSPYYANYAPSGSATTTLKRGLTYNLSLTQSTASTSSVVYIDYNDNGTFEPTETFNISMNAGAASAVNTMPITIPCDATLSSEIRMRVVSYFTGSPWPTPCTTSQNGEIQDYTLTIIDNSMDYTYSSATQFSGTVSASTTHKVMMKLPIVAQGCGAGFLTEVRCHTAKTMNAVTNISSAKLYSTGTSNVFTTTELLASVPNPSGTFVFNGFSDSLYSNTTDTNYYWITYDMSATAVANDTIDVRIDSINATNRFVIPNNNNPIEYLIVKPTNTYTNSDVSHPINSRTIKTGQLYSPALLIRIVGSSTGAPLQLTQLNFDPAGGGNDTLNISAARVFYTGNSKTFSQANQFGNTYTAGTNISGIKWNLFNISGIQALNFDTNYFWLAYDISNNAAVNDSVDADLVSFNIGVSQVPTTRSVAGALKIKQNYCFMGPSGNAFSSSQSPSSFEDITNVQFGTINNSSTCAQTGGVGSILGQYSDYSDIVTPANILTSSTVSFSLTGVSNCNMAANNTQNMSFVILIDWDQNGLFDLNTEVAYRSAASTSVRTYSGNVYVPCTALPGYTRMRVIYGTGSNAANALLLGTACGNASTSTYIYGETEDYTLNVINNPVSTVKTSFVQSTGLVGQGVSDVSVLRIAVKPVGCGANLNTLNFSLTGTTALADITAAKLYTTGTSNVFSTNTLLGNVTPASSIQFTGLTNVLTNESTTDSNYFWLAYDVAPGATAANLLDARLDSLSIGGTWYNTLITGNPAGNRVVAAKMAYVSSTVAQPDLTSVAIGTTNR
jgi:hypothetical protein